MGLEGPCCFNGKLPFFENQYQLHHSRMFVHTAFWWCQFTFYFTFWTKTFTYPAMNWKETFFHVSKLLPSEKRSSKSSENKQCTPGKEEGHFVSFFLWLTIVNRLSWKMTLWKMEQTNPFLIPVVLSGLQNVKILVKVWISHYSVTFNFFQIRLKTFNLALSSIALS